jgi:hypothetical protein
MHQWGDCWFEKYGSNLYFAIDEFEHICRKYGGIKIYGKEKYGTYRDEYLRLWDGGLHSMIYKSLVRIENNFIYWRLDPILRFIFTYTGILKLIHSYQASVYNYGMQKMCKKFPDIVNELVSDLDGYKMVKPGIFGKVDGKEIHEKYWTTL